jgi:hypothetical protein
MRSYSQKDLDEYLKNDWVLEEIKKYLEDNVFASQKWLSDIPAKRMIYADVYGELLKTKGKKILDVAGGFCGLSRKLIKNHNYTLVDIMTKDNHEKLRQIEKETGCNFWQNISWDEFEIKDDYDLIIVNDIFPNIDQRLGKFLKKYKSQAKEMILTLTCYDMQSKLADFSERIINSVYNRLKRVDADKIIFVRAPETKEVNKILKNILGRNTPVLEENNESIFKNGRTVYKIEIK